MSETFIPTKGDMHKMVKAFVSIHVEDEGHHIKDDIGPNAPDAPFFKRVAAQDEMDEMDYVEMTTRLEKYIGTQLPAIQHIAGYSADTDWEAALQTLKKIGEAAIYKDKEGKKVLSDWHLEQLQKGEPHYTPEDRVNMIVRLVKLGFDYDKAEGMANKQLAITVLAVEESLIKKEQEKQYKKAETKRKKESMTVEVYEFDEVWYSQNDYQQRYPRKSKRLALDWKSRNTALYEEMREEIPWPSFKWDGARMSVSLDATIVQRAITVLKKYNYITTNIENYLDNMAVIEIKTNSSGYSVVLKGDGLLIRIPYNDVDSRTAVKGVSGRRWLPDTKQWSVPISEANILIKKLKDAALSIDGVDKHPLIKEMEGIDEVSTYLKEKAERIAISSAATLSDDDLVKDMKKRLSEHFPKGHKLYPFQYAGVKFAELANGRCLLGDDMGIGKTIQALAYAALHEELRPVLVVCPANVKYNWAKEIATWLPKTSLQVIKTGKQEIEVADFTVINYDLVSRQEDALHALGAQLIIFDESHYLKNKGTKSKPIKRTVACTGLAENAASILCLSGTAITNRPIELFTTLEMIRPAEYKGQFFPYAKRYCGANYNGWGWDFTGASNVGELHEKLRDCMIRRLKKEVMAELPDKVRQFIPVVPTQAEMSDYKRVHRQWMTDYSHYKQSGGLPAGFVLNMLTDLRHHAGRLKVSATADWIAEYHKQNDKPLVVYVHHRDVGKGLYDLMTDDKRFNHKRWRAIAGGTPSITRQQYVEEFQSGKLDGLLCSTIAAKEGITLTAADTVVFVEREWVSGWEEQAEDRINRIGQDSETVWATYLSVVGTIDEKFDRIVEQKREVVSAVLDGTEVGGTREGVAKALLQAMVDAGEIPAEMLKDMGIAKPKTHTEE